MLLGDQEPVVLVVMSGGPVDISAEKANPKVSVDWLMGILMSVDWLM